MAEERKKYLKSTILNAIQVLIENNEYSLEELEECSAILNNIIEDKDDLTHLQEENYDK
jgi:hypothetical protein